MSRKQNQNADAEKQSDQSESDDERIDSTPPADASLMERIIWVRNRVGTLGKDSNVGGQYKAISHDKVTKYIRPKLNQAGIFYYMTCVAVNDVDTGQRTNQGRTIEQHRACYEVHFVNADNEQDRLVITQWGYADDRGDKGPGKAASYALKYVFLKLFLIETGEEDEERIEGDDIGAAQLCHDEAAMADVWAKAEEYFGEDADAMLSAMAQRKFYVDVYGAIPLDRKKEALHALKIKFNSMQRD